MKRSIEGPYEGRFNRRVFVRGTAGAALGLTFVQLGCELNEVRGPPGGEFPFITPIQFDNDSLEVRSPEEQLRFHFFQLGGRTVPEIDNSIYATLPIVGSDAWRLTVDGLVGQPLELTLADLQAKTAETITILKTIRCVVDQPTVPGLVGTALWRGVPLRSVLEDAGVDMQNTARIRYFGRDGFTNNLRFSEVFSAQQQPWEQPILAWSVNGMPVPHAHGGPVRLLVPTKYGFKNMKWIERVQATDDDSVFGSYQSIGFFDEGTIQVYTKVSNPLAQQTIPAGTFQIFGYGLSGFAPVSQIELQIDDGPFMPAELIPLTEVAAAYPELEDSAQFQANLAYPYRDVWSLFRFDWEATPGEHRLRFRTTDALGNTQPEEDLDGSDGLTGWFNVTVNVTA